jgi:hypothetical protein
MVAGLGLQGFAHKKGDATNNFQDREPGVVTSMISNLKWESLEQRCAKARTVLMYKIIHNLVEIRCCQFIWIPVLIAPYSVFSNVNSLSNKTVTMFHNLFCTISTKLCMILYIRTVLAFAHFCSRDSHFKLEIIDVTTKLWNIVTVLFESEFTLENTE